MKGINKSQKGFRAFWNNFLQHKIAVICMCFLITEVIALLVIPLFLELDPNRITATLVDAAPTEGHPLGGDATGRDMLARIIYGGRTSLYIGVLATVIGVIMGVPLGLIAGYYRGPAELIIMRMADIFMSFPHMILILVVVAVFGSNATKIAIIMGILSWTGTAKLLYGNVLSVRSNEYVEASRVEGNPSFKTIVKTVLPNSISPLWCSLAFRMSSAMIMEAGLSFLGAGVQPPNASWGNIIQSATSLAVLTLRWWQWLPAALCLVVTVICINFIGEGIRDALDPKMLRQ